MTQVAPRGGAVSLLAGRIGGVAGSLAASQVLVGLTYVLAARQMGPAELGLVATCVAIGMISATVFDLGLANFLVRELAAGRTSFPEARALLRTKRRVVALLVVPTTVVCVLIMPSLVEGLVLGVVGWLFWESQTANSLLRAQERFSRAATGQLVGRASGLGTTVVLLFVTGPVLALAIGLAVGFGAEAVLDRAFLGAPGTPAAGLGQLVVAQRHAVSFGMVTLSAVGQQLDTPLVTLGGGLAAGGIYAGAGRLIGPLLFLSSALALVAAPWLARAQSDPDGLRLEERRIARFSFVLALAPLLAAAAGPFVIPWILGPQFAGSGIAFSVLAIGAALSTLSQGTATVLQNRGAEGSVGRAIAIGLTLSLVATFVLAALGGAAWAAAGYTLSQLYIVVHLTLRLRIARSRDRSAAATAASSGSAPEDPVSR